jgi:hypothetical protein
MVYEFGYRGQPHYGMTVVLHETVLQVTIVDVHLYNTCSDVRIVIVIHLDTL